MTTDQSEGCGCLLIFVLIGLFLCIDHFIDSLPEIVQKLPETVQVTIVHKQETP